MNRYLNDVQATDLSRAVSLFENARSWRLKWAGYSRMTPDQVRSMIEQATRTEQRPGDVISTYTDSILTVEPATDTARADFERLAAENTANRERAERTLKASAESQPFPGTTAYLETVEANRRIHSYLELHEAYAEHLSRPWPTAEELRVGVAVVAAPVLLLLRQRAAAMAFQRLLPTRQRAEETLRGLDGYNATARAFCVAAGRDLPVASWDADQVSVLRRVAALESINIAERQKEEESSSCPSST